MLKLKIGVLGSTRGTDLQVIIDSIQQTHGRTEKPTVGRQSGVAKLNAEIVLVVSDKKDAFILDRAKKHGIETLFVDYKKYKDRQGAEREIAEKLREKGANLVLLIGFMKILSPDFISMFRGRIWNIHPSLLPKYAGGMNLDVHSEVLRNGDKETGCTLHEVTEKVDEGRVILQKKVLVLGGDTPEALKERVQKAEQECLLEAIKMVSEKKIVIG